MHKRVFLAVIALLLPFLIGCGQATSSPNAQNTPAEAATAKPILYCGSSMRLPVEELVKQFREKTQRDVEVVYGGSETLLPMIQTSGRGELFVTHDPFPKQLQDEGRLKTQYQVGYLVPSLVVRPGNPHKLADLPDLGKPGLRVGLLDARYATCGEMVRNELARRNCWDAVAKNLKVEKRSHQELATDLELDAIDAAAIWSFVAAQNKGKIEVVPTTANYPEINVAICELKTAQSSATLTELIRALTDDQAKAVFAKYGYAKSAPAATP